MLPILAPSRHGTSSKADKKPLRFLGIRFSALAEMLVMFTCFMAVDRFFFAGSTAPYVIHPYWLVLFFLTLRYGFAEAMTCAFLATLFLWFSLPPQETVMQTVYEYLRGPAALPFMWTSLALIAGPLRSGQIHEHDRLRHELSAA